MLDAKDKVILRTGTIGLVVAAVCCFTPAFILFLGPAGLWAWLAGHGYILLSVLVLILAVATYGLFHRHPHEEDN